MPEGKDAGLFLAMPEDFRPPDIPSRKIGQGPFALVLMFYACHSTWPARRRPMLAPVSLDACLLIRREHTVRIRQGRTLPETFIEIEDTPSLLAEQRIPGKEPAAMAPGWIRTWIFPSTTSGHLLGVLTPVGAMIRSHKRDFVCGEVPRRYHPVPVRAGSRGIWSLWPGTNTLHPVAEGDYTVYGGCASLTRGARCRVWVEGGIGEAVGRSASSRCAAVSCRSQSGL